MVDFIVDSEVECQHTEAGMIAGMTSLTNSHSRHSSAASTLLVSLRRHVSEPFLRRAAYNQVFVNDKVKPSNEIFMQLKELKASNDKNTWTATLASQEAVQTKAIADLKEEHRNVVKELHAALVTADDQLRSKNKRNQDLEKQIKKETSAKLRALKQCELLEEKLAEAEHNAIAISSSLQDRNTLILREISDLQAREASYQAVIVAATESNANLMQQTKTMKEVTSRAKREWEHSRFKLWELQRALDGKPMLDNVDQQATINYQVDRIKFLTTNAISLSTELEQLEDEVTRREAATRVELEEIANKLVRIDFARELAEEKLKIVREAYKELLSQPRSWFRCSQDKNVQVMSKCLEASHKEGEVLRSAVAQCQSREAAAEEDRFIWERRYRSLSEEMSSKQRKLEELEESFRQTDCNLCSMTIELEAVTREKTTEIDACKRRIADLESNLEGLSRQLDLLGKQEVSAQVNWCIDFKTAHNAQLQGSLQQTNEYLKSLETYVRETEYTAQADTELEQYADEMMKDLRYNLYHTEEECMQLRMENRALHDQLKAADQRGRRNAFWVEEQIQKDKISNADVTGNDSLQEALLNHKSNATEFKDTLRGIPIDTASRAMALLEENDARMANAKQDLSELSLPLIENGQASKENSGHSRLRDCLDENITEKSAETFRSVPGDLAVLNELAAADREEGEGFSGSYDTSSIRAELYGHLEGCYAEYFEDIEEVDMNLPIAERSLLYTRTRILSD